VSYLSLLALFQIFLVFREKSVICLCCQKLCCYMQKWPVVASEYVTKCLVVLVSSCLFAIPYSHYCSDLGSWRWHIITHTHARTHTHTHSGVQGQSPWSAGQGGEAPLKLKAFYCRREQIWNLNFAAICQKGPERRSGDQKKNRNGVPVRSGSKRTLAGTYASLQLAPDR